MKLEDYVVKPDSGEKLSVYPYNEIVRFEREELADLYATVKKEDLEAIDKVDGHIYTTMSREEIADLRDVKKKIDDFEGKLNRYFGEGGELVSTRALAIAHLESSIRDGIVKDLKRSIAEARDVELEGSDENGPWMIELVRDAYVAKREGERRREIVQKQVRTGGGKTRGNK